MKAFFESLFGTDKKIKKEDKLFIIETPKIIKKEDGKGGLIINIETLDSEKFAEISLTGEPEVVSVKKGVSKVVQDLKLPYDNSGVLLARLKQAMKNKISVSILHITPEEHCYLYGENIGLTITELTENLIMLEGEEADAFYEVEFETAKKITS